MITVKELEALRPANNGQRVSMGESMYGTVRAARDGSISVYVVWRYRFQGMSRQMPIGTWKIGRSLRELREAKSRAAAQLACRIDPIEANRAARLKSKADQLEDQQSQLDRFQALAAKSARLTLRQLFDIWSQTDLQRRTDRGAEASRSFERDVFPTIGDVAVEDITKAHVQQIIDTMLSRGVKRMAERVLSDLRQLFGFAIDRDYVAADPTAKIKKHRIGGSNERDRVLSEAELIELFKALPSSGLTPASQAALLIQLSTCARIGEVLNARWEHIDFERREWTLPKTKNDRRHAIYLSDIAMEQFRIQKEASGLTAWVFPASRKVGAVCSKTVTKQVADRQRSGQSPLPGRSKQTTSLLLAGGQWRPHDLRRTGATLMAELGVLPDIVERCLNHVEQEKMKRIYQKAKYHQPMRDAWQILSDRLDLLKSERSDVHIIKQRIA